MNRSPPAFISHPFSTEFLAARCPFIPPGVADQTRSNVETILAVAIGQSICLDSPTHRPIVSARNSDDDVLFLSPGDSPFYVIATGISPGIVNVAIEEQEGVVGKLWVEVVEDVGGYEA